MMQTRRRSLPATALVLVLGVLGCGGDGSTSPPATEPATTEANETTETTDGAPVRVASTHYPYAVTLPADQVTGSRSADLAWDGVARIEQAAPFNDRIFTPDGVVFIFGLAWPEDAASLAQMVVDRQAGTHNCSAEQELRREVTVAETPAVAFVQGGCGVDQVAFARLAVVHDAFGLVAFMAVTDDTATALDALVTTMSGLEWVTG